MIYLNSRRECLVIVYTFWERNVLFSAHSAVAVAGPTLLSFCALWFTVPLTSSCMSYQHAYG